MTFEPTNSHTIPLGPCPRVAGVDASCTMAPRRELRWPLEGWAVWQVQPARARARARSRRPRPPQSLPLARWLSRRRVPVCARARLAGATAGCAQGRAREWRRATGLGCRRCSAPTRALTIALAARTLRILPRDSLVTAGAPVPCMCVRRTVAAEVLSVDALLRRGYSSGHSGAGGRRGRVAARVARGGGGAEGARLFFCFGVAVPNGRMMSESRES